MITITKNNNTSSPILLDHCYMYAFGFLTVACWSGEFFFKERDPS